MFKTLTSAIDKNKTPSEDEINKISSYIFCKWLSGSPHAIQAANMINCYHAKIPMVNQYFMIKSAFGGKIKYIPYPKNVSVSDNKKVEYLVDYFKISESKGREYLQLIDKKELKSIVNMYEKRK